MVVTTPAGHTMLLRVGKVIQRLKSYEVRNPVRLRTCRLTVPLGHQCRTDCPHEFGVGCPDDLSAKIFFKRPQHGIVEEGAALHDDSIPKPVKVVLSDDLGKDVLYHRTAKPRHDVIASRAATLSGDYAAVHEYRASAAQ